MFTILLALFSLQLVKGATYPRTESWYGSGFVYVFHLMQQFGRS